MCDTHSILLEETRSNFYQLEGLTLNLDMKAFGIAAIDALLFSIFVHIFSYFINIPMVLYVPLLILGISLVFVIFCIWPQDWDRQDAPATLDKYEAWEAESVARQLARNYADSVDEILQKYQEKFGFFQTSLRLAILAFILEVFIILAIYR